MTIRTDTAHTGFPYYVGCILLAVAAVLGIFLAGIVIQSVLYPDTMVLMNAIKAFLANTLPVMAVQRGEQVATINVEPDTRLVAVLLVLGLLLIGYSALMNGLIRGGISLVNRGK